MTIGATLVWLATIWLYVGGAVAVAFLFVGIDRVSEDARGAYLFRPLLVPGVVLLWPLVLWRWLQLERGTSLHANRYRPLREAHARVWMVLAILIPLILITGLTIRQPVPTTGAAVRLEAPN
jgi:uncharacterized membrane protein